MSPEVQREVSRLYARAVRRPRSLLVQTPPPAAGAVGSAGAAREGSQPLVQVRFLCTPMNPPAHPPYPSAHLSCPVLLASTRLPSLRASTPPFRSASADARALYPLMHVFKAECCIRGALRRNSGPAILAWRRAAYRGNPVQGSPPLLMITSH
jgi:hypothetical protein